MKIELAEQIYRAAPELYRRELPYDAHMSERQRMRLTTPTYLGVGDGWFQIIMNLSVALEALGEPIEVTQVKEKFGTLCFYVGSASDAAFDLIEEAEERSRYTCEVCGEPGKVWNDRGWLSTTCDKHREEE